MFECFISGYIFMRTCAMHFSFSQQGSAFKAMTAWRWALAERKVIRLCVVPAERPSSVMLEALSHRISLDYSPLFCCQMRPESFFFLLTYRDQMISENSISNMSRPTGVNVGRLWCKVSVGEVDLHLPLICLRVIDSYYYGVIKAFDRGQERGLGLCLG